MNIVYLHSHDTGRYIQPYGHPVQTPALQQLAESGTLFRDAHCAAPTCSPSRASLLTGQSAHGAGMVALAHRGGKLLHPERHLANFLKSQGFVTRRSGIAHVGGSDAEQGYDSTAEVNHRDGREIAKDAAAFLQAQDGSQPFFLDAGFLETHRTEWVCHGFNQEQHSPKDGDGNPDYVLPPAPLPDCPETRRDWLDFRHSVERLDSFYAHILEALEKTGLADDTLVLATTDHGIAFPGMKCSLTQHGSGVLCILKLPKKLGQGKVIDATISHLDIYPTICELLNAPAPDWLEGKSLLPLIRGEKDRLHDAVFGEVTFHAAFEPKRSVRNERWLYIRNANAPTAPILPNCDNGHSKQHWLKQGWAEKTIPAEELYDRTFDPQERDNLAADPAYAGILTDMRTRLDDWMQQTQDPLLSEDPSVMPLPQTVNTPDQTHPGPDSSEWDPGEWKPLHVGA